MNYKKACIIALGLGMILGFCGCGQKDPVLEKYKTEMNDITTDLEELVSRLDAIDGESPEAKEDLLLVMDDMNEKFRELADIEVPDQFASISDLADEASQNMEESVSIYHEIFEEMETPNESYIEGAEEYYSRAFKRIGIIGTLLKGELPDDEDVTVEKANGNTQ